MTALITLSHGSRHPGAEAGVRRLTRAAGELLDVAAVAAHLDFTEPSLPDAARALAECGHRAAVVVPLLFTHAFHARHDVPAALAEARHASGLDLHLADGLGTGDLVAEVLTARLALDAPDGAHVVLYPVGTSDAAAAAGVEKLAANVGERSGHSIQVVPATGGRGSGGAGVLEAATGHDAVHLLPLFVTDGLLLDQVTGQLGRMQAATGTRLTSSPPLTTDLARVVARRHSAVAPALT